MKRTLKFGDGNWRLFEFMYIYYIYPELSHEYAAFGSGFSCLYQP